MEQSTKSAQKTIKIDWDLVKPLLLLFAGVSVGAIAGTAVTNSIQSARFEQKSAEIVNAARAALNHAEPIVLSAAFEQPSPGNYLPNLTQALPEVPDTVGRELSGHSLSFFARKMFFEELAKKGSSGSHR